MNNKFITAKQCCDYVYDYIDCDTLLWVYQDYAKHLTFTELAYLAHTWINITHTEFYDFLDYVDWYFNQ